MHRNHGIDRGTEVTEGSGAWGGYPVWPGVPPPRKKAYIFFLAYFGAFGFIQEFFWESYNVLPTQLYCPNFRD